MRYVFRFALAALTLLITACSMSGNISDLTVRTTTISVGQLTGIVPGAIVQTTAGGYQMTATVGEPYASVVSTSSGGYTMYSNLSGNMASSALITNLQ